MPFVYSEMQARHEPDGEVWVGVRTPGTELPQRAERILNALRVAGAAEHVAIDHPDEEALALHDPDLCAYLESAWEEWQASGLKRDPGQNRVVPYLFPHPGLMAGMRPGGPPEPTAAAARAGRFCFDTMTLIGPGTWGGARAAVDVALTAADLVRDGAPAAYALCRPPGHHASSGSFGGSCYLNNTAAAAARLQAGSAGPVAVLDIDAHHGNGAQEIFWTDASVLTGSVHVDPGAGWFPHFLGFGDERGAEAAEGTNQNLALAPGSGDELWLEAIGTLLDWARAGGAAALIVALGVDAAGADPESPLQVSPAGFRAAGSLLAGAALPTVFVQEGGYDLDSIGALVVETLSGFDARRAELSRGSG